MLRGVKTILKQLQYCFNCIQTDAFNIIGLIHLLESSRLFRLFKTVSNFEPKTWDFNITFLRVVSESLIIIHISNFTAKRDHLQHFAL
jgi:hypothetical protein